MLILLQPIHSGRRLGVLINRLGKFQQRCGTVNSDIDGTLEKSSRANEGMQRVKRNEGTVNNWQSI